MVSEQELMAELRTIGETLDGDFVAAVELGDGSLLDEVYFKMDEQKKRIQEIWGITNQGYVRLDPSAIRVISPSPYKVPDDIAIDAWRRGESGMGYFRINVYLRNGQVLRNLIVGRPYVIRLPAPHVVEDIERIEHAGFH